MFRRSLATGIAAALLGGVFAACSEDSPVAPADPHQMSMDVAPVETFTYRAPLDPYGIHQLPDFNMRSRATKDIVIQRSVFNPGPGMWHTHPGPSFIYVISGQIKLERVNKRGRCTETPVSGPGQAYFEIADQVHRAVVVSAEPAVVLVTRFNIPVGQPFTIPADDPKC
jgi:quercetin dioxygenase-like cupin family protein